MAIRFLSIIQKFTLDIPRFFSVFILLCTGFSSQSLAQSSPSPNLVTIDSKGRVSITLSPQDHNLLGLFFYKDPQIIGIEVSAANDFSVWKNGVLWSSDSNYHLFTANNLLTEQDTVFLAFHSRTKFEDFHCQYLMRFEELNNSFENSVSLRSSLVSKNSFILFTLVFILLIGTYKFVSSASLLEYFRKIFFKRIRVYSGFDDARITLPELAITSLSVGISIWHIKGNHQLIIGYEFSDQVRDVLLYSVYVLIFLAGKFFLVRIISKLNGLEKFEVIQFIDFTKYYLMLSLFLNTALFSIFWFGDLREYSISKTWEYFYPVTYLIFILYYFFKLSSVLPRKKLLLISYLCTTEILGAFIVSTVLIS